MRNRYPLYGRTSTGMQRPANSPRRGPFGNDVSNPLAPVAPAPPDVVESIRNTYEWPVPVILPRQSHAPEGARTMDFRRLLTIPAGAQNVGLVDYLCMEGATTVIHHYGLILPAGGFPDISWSVVIGGKKMLQYHGDPGTLGPPLTPASSNPPTILNLPTGSDFSSVSLVECQIFLQPGNNIRWRANNNTLAPIQMGVRVVGYVDMSQQLLSTKFGD